MGFRSNKFSLWLLILMTVTGCTSVGSMRSADMDEGMVQLYDGSYQEVYKAAKLAMGAVGLSLEEENFDQKYLIGRNSGHTNGIFISYGELVGVYFTPRTEDRTEVRVVSKRVYKPGMFYYEDFTGDVHSAINSYLIDVKAGRI